MGTLLAKEPTEPINKELLYILKEKKLDDLYKCIDIINMDY